MEDFDYQKLAELIAQEMRKELLNRDDVCAILGYGRQSSAFSRLLEQDPTFPKPTELVENGRKKWFKKDVLAWIERQREARSRIALHAHLMNRKF